MAFFLLQRPQKGQLAFVPLVCFALILLATQSQGQKNEEEYTNLSHSRVTRGVDDWFRAGRNFFNPARASNRRQSSSGLLSGLSSPEPGQISFKLPFLSALGLPQPVVPLVTSLLRYRMDQMRRMWWRTAPALQKLRRTFDKEVAPNLGEGVRHTMAGLAAGVDTLAEVVMGEEAKQETFERVGQTMDALNILARSMVGSDSETDPPDQIYAQHQNPNRVQYPPHFEYQDFDVYGSASYPDYQYQSSSNERRDNFDSYYVKDNKYYYYSDKDKYNTRPKTVEEALYILGKNLLGQNVTDRLFPVAKQVAEGFSKVGDGIKTIKHAIPPILSTSPTSSSSSSFNNAVEFDSSGVRVKTLPLEDQSKSQTLDPGSARDERNADKKGSSSTDQRITNKESTAPKCTTPNQGPGRCMDIQNCPLLLADLDKLRKSICFKALFVPGVCCPDSGVQLEVIDDGLNLVNEVQEVEGSAGSFSSSSSTSLPQDDRPLISEVFGGNQGETPGISDIQSNQVIGTSLECGATKVPQGRIVGGNTTFEGEFPWMAAIYLHGQNRREFWCGGALITPNHVITAAHCTRDAKKKPFQARQFTVRVGEWDLTDDDSYSREFNVVSYTAHPDFRPNGFYNDIAIFKLERKVRLTSHIQPICLPTGRNLYRDYVGSLPIAAGWGTTHYGGKEVAKLQGVPLPVWTNKDCDNAYFQPITEVFLCAGYADGGRDACQGDSGGPLMLYDDQEC